MSRMLYIVIWGTADSIHVHDMHDVPVHCTVLTVIQSYSHTFIQSYSIQQTGDSSQSVSQPVYMY